jgi:hypothetical protein
MAMPARAESRPTFTLSAVAGLAGLVVVGSMVAALAPPLDHALNPTATRPGVVSFLGVGLTVLALTVVLLLYGLRGMLPRTAIFAAAAIGYNALLIAVKLGLGPIAIYAQNDWYRAHPLPPGQFGEDPGFRFLTLGLAYPGVAALMAILYGAAFFFLYLLFKSGLQRKLGMRVALERRAVQLIIAMFCIAVAGAVTLLGLLGFIEYAVSIVYAGTVAILIAVDLVAAIALCSVAFREAADQSAALRNVSVLSTFAWIGLAFIAAYHIIWVVFLLTLVSTWPLKPWAYITGGAK